MKTTFISNLWRKQHLTSYNLQKIKKRAKYGVFKTKELMEKLFHSMNILDFSATIQLGDMWRRQSTTEMLKRKGKFKRSGVRNRRPAKNR